MKDSTRQVHKHLCGNAWRNKSDKIIIFCSLFLCFSSFWENLNEAAKIIELNWIYLTHFSTILWVFVTFWLAVENAWSWFSLSCTLTIEIAFIHCWISFVEAFAACPFLMQIGIKTLLFGNFLYDFAMKCERYSCRKSNNFINFTQSFYRTMTAICFVCNLPIMSHQVGLVWSGGNGWDDLMREQVNLISFLTSRSSQKPLHDSNLNDFYLIFRSVNQRSASVWVVVEIQQLKYLDSHPQALLHRPIETVDEARWLN